MSEVSGPAMHALAALRMCKTFSALQVQGMPVAKHNFARGSKVSRRVQRLRALADELQRESDRIDDMLRGPERNVCLHRLARDVRYTTIITGWQLVLEKRQPRRFVNGSGLGVFCFVFRPLPVLGLCL